MLVKMHQSPRWKMTRMGLTMMLLGSLLGLLSSCSLAILPSKIFGKKLRVQVNVSESANQNHPVQLDLLLVYKKKLGKKLLKLSAKEWFAKRDQFKRDYPDRKRFDSWEWEWVPGQQVVEQKLPLRGRAKLGIIFANYLSPGDHRVRIHPRKSIVIDLDEQDFTVRRLR